MHSRWQLCFALLTSMALVIGCGSGDRPAVTGTVPFTGTVKLDGNPLANASITLVPMDSNNAVDAGALTDESGKFAIQSDGGRAEGAKPGEYKVIINRLVKPDGSVALLTPEKSPMQLMTEENAKESLPPKYSDILKTTLKTSVPAAGGTQDFDLQSK